MNPTDAALAARLRDGDAAAFATVFDRYADAVYGFARRRLACPADAEDLVATTFLEVWRQRSSAGLRGETDSLRPWLFGIASNLVRRQWRTRARHRRALDRLAAQRPIPDAETGAAAVDVASELSSVARRIAGLPTRDREVLALRALDGLTYQEMSDALGVPVGTVRSRLSRARSKLDAATPPTRPPSPLPDPDVPERNPIHAHTVFHDA